MTTSGTYTFAVTAEDVILAAFRKMQVYGPNDAGPSANDITYAMQAFNLMIKEMALDGLPLWCVVVLQIPLVQGQSVYPIGPQGSPVTVKPLVILDAWNRDSTGNDVQLQITSRYDYDTLGQKSSTGIVNQIFYDPQIGNTVAPPGSGFVTVYDVPSDSTHTMFLVVQRMIQDIALTTNNLDFPQEAYKMLVYGLCDDLMDEYEVGDKLSARLSGKALFYRKKFFDSCQEQASVIFTPSQRMC